MKLNESSKVQFDKIHKEWKKENRKEEDNSPSWWPTIGTTKLQFCFHWLRNQNRKYNTKACYQLVWNWKKNNKMQRQNHEKRRNKTNLFISWLWATVVITMRDLKPQSLQPLLETMSNMRDKRVRDSKFWKRWRNYLKMECKKEKLLGLDNPMIPMDFNDYKGTNYW